MLGEKRIVWLRCWSKKSHNMDVTWKGTDALQPALPFLFGLRSLKDRWPFLSSSGHHPNPRLRSFGSKRRSLKNLVFAGPDMNAFDKPCASQLTCTASPIELLFITSFFFKHACNTSSVLQTRAFWRRWIGPDVTHLSVFNDVFFCSYKMQCVLITLHFHCVTVSGS